MTVSVIILNWNGRALLEEFLPSVVCHTPAEIAEIIVADNGSSDDSVAWLNELFPSIRVIRLEKNFGFAEGYNKAIAQIDSLYTVLLNSDVEVTPGWLEAPLSMLEADRSIAAVQPKILSFTDKKKFEYAGAAGGFIDRYGYPFCRGRVLSVVEKDHGQYDTVAELLWASGACLFIRTEVYEQEGGLDANFFAHQEEVDMCWRLRARGYRIVCTPQSVVYHVGGGTLNVESQQKTYLNFRNNLLMLYKNLPQKEVKKVLRVRWWLDWLAAFQFFITGHPKNTVAVARARRDFKRLRKDYAVVREENLQKTVTGLISEIYPSSLLLAFYIGGKKSFSELFSPETPCSLHVGRQSFKGGEK